MSVGDENVKPPEVEVAEEVTPDKISPESSLHAIEYLSLGGGGMGGVGHVGVLEELEKAGILSRMKEVVGVSAGGFLATLLSVGYSAFEIKKIMMEVDFRKFQDKPEPGWIEASKLKHVTSAAAIISGAADKVLDDLGKALDSIPVVGEALKKGIATTPAGRVIDGVQASAGMIAKFDKAVGVAEKIEDVVVMASGNSFGLFKGDALQEWLEGLIAAKTGNGKMTFAEHALYAEEHGYMKPTIPVMSLSTRQPLYLSARDERFRDIPLAIAARAGGAFPGGFRPVVIPEKRKDGTVFEHIATDGGVHENVSSIFNQPPYYLGPGKSNPKAFFVGLENSKEQQEIAKGKQVKNIADFLISLVESKLSQERVLQEAGDHAIRVDRALIGTLEFDAPDRIKEYVSNLAAQETRRVLTQIRDKDKDLLIYSSDLPLEERIKKEKALSEIPLEELMRKKVALLDDLKNYKKGDDKFEEIYRKINLLDRIFHEKRLTSDEIKQMQDDAVAQFKINREKLEKLKLEQTLNDETLLEQLENSIASLELKENNTNQEIESFRIAKMSLETHRDLVEMEFDKNPNEEGSFKLKLTEIGTVQDSIRKCKSSLTELDSQYQSGKIQREEYDKRQKENKKAFEKLQRAKKDLFSNLIGREGIYKDNEAIKLFLKNVKIKSDLYDDYDIPVSTLMLRDHYKKDLKLCTDSIPALEAELQSISEKKEKIKALKKNFKNKIERKTLRYDELGYFKTELDRNLYQKTDLVVKISSKLASKVGGWKPYVRLFAGLLGGMSICIRASMGLALLPVTLPAAVIKFTSKDAKTRDTMTKCLEVFFGWNNIEKQGKLLALREKAEEFLKLIDKKYADLDGSETTYLKKLFSIYLKDSKFKFEDAFARNEGETDENYLKRIEMLKDRFKIDVAIDTTLHVTSDAVSKPLLLGEASEKQILDFLKKLKSMPKNKVVGFEGYINEKQLFDLKKKVDKARDIDSFLLKDKKGIIKSVIVEAIAYERMFEFLERLKDMKLDETGQNVVGFEGFINTKALLDLKKDLEKVEFVKSLPLEDRDELVKEAMAYERQRELVKVERDRFIVLENNSEEIFGQILSASCKVIGEEEVAAKKDKHPKASFQVHFIRQLQAMEDNKINAFIKKLKAREEGENGLAGFENFSGKDDLLKLKDKLNKEDISEYQNRLSNAEIDLIDEAIWHGNMRKKMEFMRDKRKIIRAHAKHGEKKEEEEIKAVSEEDRALANREEEIRALEDRTIPSFDEQLYLQDKFLDVIDNITDEEVSDDQQAFKLFYKKIAEKIRKSDPLSPGEISAMQELYNLHRMGEEDIKRYEDQLKFLGLLEDVIQKYPEGQNEVLLEKYKQIVDKLKNNKPLSFEEKRLFEKAYKFYSSDSEKTLDSLNRELQEASANEQQHIKDFRKFLDKFLADADIVKKYRSGQVERLLSINDKIKNGTPPLDKSEEETIRVFYAEYRSGADENVKRLRQKFGFVLVDDLQAHGISERVSEENQKIMAREFIEKYSPGEYQDLKQSKLSPKPRFDPKTASDDVIIEYVKCKRILKEPLSLEHDEKLKLAMEMKIKERFIKAIDNKFNLALNPKTIEEFNEYLASNPQLIVDYVLLKRQLGKENEITAEKQQSYCSIVEKMFQEDIELTKEEFAAYLKFKIPSDAEPNAIFIDALKKAEIFMALLAKYNDWITAEAWSKLGEAPERRKEALMVFSRKLEHTPDWGPHPHRSHPPKRGK